MQDRVETWLKKNEQFTNNFVLDWVKNHPELHLALFYSNSSFIRPHAPVLPDKIVDSTNSKDSGVEDDQVQPELSVEKGLSTLKIQDVEDELDLETVAVHQVQSDYEPLQVLDIHPETIRAERIEVLTFSVQNDTSIYLWRNYILRAVLQVCTKECSSMYHAKSKPIV